MRASLRTLLAVFTSEQVVRTRQPLTRISHRDMGVPNAAPIYPILHLKNEAEVGFLFWHEERLFCFDNSPGKALLLANNPPIEQEFPFVFKEYPDVEIVGLFKKKVGLMLRIIADDIWIAKAPILDNPTLWPVWDMGERVQDNKLVGIMETPIEIKG